MSRGKYLSLEEARSSGKIKQFAKEHPTKGSKRAVLETIRRMVKASSKGRETESK